MSDVPSPASRRDGEVYCYVNRIRINDADPFGSETHVNLIAITSSVGGSDIKQHVTHLSQSTFILVDTSVSLRLPLMPPDYARD